MHLLLISSSNVHGYGFLDHSEPEIRAVGAKRVAFVPFALFDRDAYTAKVRERLGRMEIDVVQVRGVRDLDGVDGMFIGGGNTFRLLKTLYELDLLDPIRERVRSGLRYIGSSAGTIVTCPTIRTTNDMPIVEPPTLTSLGLIPFQLNCHFLDPDPNSTHKGETREERLLQYHEENTTPVVGLREGSMLRVEGDRITLLGEKTARIYLRGREPYEVPPGPLTVGS
jgi:dipeptidase E